jgi:hypothetical protein
VRSGVTVVVSVTTCMVYPSTGYDTTYRRYGNLHAGESLGW